MAQDRRGNRVDHLLIAVMGAALMLAIASVFGAGMSTSVAGFRISATTVFRPVVLAAAAGLLLVWRSRHRERQLNQIWTATQRHAMTIALCLAIATIAIAMRMSLFEARASDQFGYVSQATLWAQGDLVVPQPLAAEAPWPDATWTFAPLGYRPGQRAATIVPTYPPGLPLLMAGAVRIFGPFGAFLVVPLLGGVAVFATYVLGRYIGGVACGFLASMLLMTSPVFLFQLRQPMSDVPVTAWWVLATALVATPSSAYAFAAGLAASAAILTRPNLVPLAGVLGIFILVCSPAGLRTRVRNALIFAVATLPGCVAVALINDHLYGSPFESGYGSTEELFRMEYLGTNLSTYPRWLVETETPFILLALLAPWLIRTPLMWLCVALAATLTAAYAFYLPFDNWTYLRFLLPSIPLLLILSGGVVLHLTRRLSAPLSRWAVVAACVVLMAWRWDSAGMQPPHPTDRRFAVVGEFVRDHLPSNAIVLSMQHSGSVRYYSGRPTLRWDLLDPQWLDRSFAFLRSKGYHPVVLLEEWEQPEFTKRFGVHTKSGALDWPPIATYSGEIRTDIFDPADQRRSRTPETIRAATE
jgi:hypothetical protein